MLNRKARLVCPLLVFFLHAHAENKWLTICRSFRCTRTFNKLPGYGLRRWGKNDVTSPGYGLRRWAKEGVIWPGHGREGRSKTRLFRLSCDIVATSYTGHGVWPGCNILTTSDTRTQGVARCNTVTTSDIGHGVCGPVQHSDNI